MKQEFHEYRTSNALDWDVMLSLVRKLYRDGDYRLSLLIGCSSFFGLRISDTLSLTWAMLLDDDKFVIYEKKTGKRRVVKINKGFQKHIKDCYDALHITNENEKCFLSRKKMVYSTQRINILLKEIKKKYNVRIEHFSTHSLRKCWALKVYKESGNDASLALQKLSILMNHASVSVTRTYLGITESQLLDTYDLLDF
ncbi:tyrosine-type recombinase/integrase [Xylanibacter ruminicola]|uniref:tyrosine-type recombinase/integrase n=1 Tax=Xylanibacter ruminicola TaxID=839 RepID=UPI000490C157|nr:tyrosine-type recombinase/integrase [Xylanibacter ruminicola]